MSKQVVVCPPDLKDSQSVDWYVSTDTSRNYPQTIKYISAVLDEVIKTICNININLIK